MKNMKNTVWSEIQHHHKCHKPSYERFVPNERDRTLIYQNNIRL